MDTVAEFHFDGIKLEALKRVLIGFPFTYTYKKFPDNYCGAGKGIGEKLVPDYIMGFTKFLKWFGLDISLKISPACYIHDNDYEMCEPTWEAFYDANDRLGDNIERIIEAKVKNQRLAAFYRYRATTYCNAVNLHGKSVFWTLKKIQGYSIPENAKKYVDWKKVAETN